MSTSLLGVVYNFSKTYRKKCRDENRKSEHEFKGRKNNKPSYNCKECTKNC